MPNRWHSNSIFGPGPRIPLDREQKARFRALLHIHRRPGRLTIAAAHVGRILVDMLGQDGQLNPSHATIAARASVSITTVIRGLAQLRAFGFVTWVRRLVRTAWRCEQTSSAYALALPAALFDASFLNQAKRTGLAKCKSQAEAPIACDLAAAQAALGRRREVIEERLRGQDRRASMRSASLS